MEREETHEIEKMKNGWARTNKNNRAEWANRNMQLMEHIGHTKQTYKMEHKEQTGQIEQIEYIKQMKR